MTNPPGSPINGRGGGALQAPAAVDLSPAQASRPPPAGTQGTLDTDDRGTNAGARGEPPLPLPNSPSDASAPIPAEFDLLGEATLERPVVSFDGAAGEPALADLLNPDGFEGPTAELPRPLAQLRERVGPPPPQGASPEPGGVLDVIADAVAGLGNGGLRSRPPSLPFDEATTAAELPAWSDEENDPLKEETSDLDMPRRVGTFHDEQSAEAERSQAPPEDGATMEGSPIVEDLGTDVGPPPPDAGQKLQGEDGVLVSLVDALGEQNGNFFYRALLNGEEPSRTAVWSPTSLHEPPWSHLPDPRIVRPRTRVSLPRGTLRVFDRPRGNTIQDYLGNDDRLLPAMATLELGIELAELLESLHGAGQFIYDLDPNQIIVERGGRIRFYAVGGVYPAGAMPPGQLGPYCAPEVRRRMSYRTGAHSDVFAVALLLYALLAKRAPVDVDLDPSLLVSPRVFRPECPLGIWPYLRPCLDPTPARRVGHARALKRALEQARNRLIQEARAVETQADVALEAWAEQHVGLTKARRGSGQQDRALSVTDEDGRIGLYMIADGVSRSRYGDGAFAAEQAEVSALQRWTGLEKGGQAALQLNHMQRSDIMKQIARSAGKRISAEVNARHAPVPNEPNQVMSATMCAMFVVHGEATVGNLGDSRAYLVRDGVIEQITVDHDRNTDALRMGLTFREAAGVQMGSALTRVVGRVIVDDDGTTRPDPFEPETFRVRLLPGDRVLIASDGVTDFAAGPGAPAAESDRRMLETLLEFEDPARAAFELVVLANRAGGFDNISCVVVAVHPVQ